MGLENYSTMGLQNTGLRDHRITEYGFMGLQNIGLQDMGL